MKHSARKVRKLHHDKVIAGFAGATADAFTLFESSRPNWNSITATWSARRGTGQGLAHRPRAAPPGGDARRRRQR